LGRIISKQDLIKIQKTNRFSEEEFSNLVINSTPSAWAETYLYDPDKKEKKLNLIPKQKEIIDDISNLKCLRMGRGWGKSLTMSCFILWDCMTEDNVKIFIYIPGKTQLQRIYEILENMIENSPDVKASIEINKKQNSALNKKDEIEHTVNFKNGSKIIFFLTDSKIGKIRGQHNPKRIIVDEAHYIREEAFEAIVGVITNMEDPWIWMSSTPRGKFGNFYKFSQEQNVQEYHVPSWESPFWTPAKEEAARAFVTSEAQYLREFGAEWGSEDDTVYSDIDIDEALLKSSMVFGNLVLKQKNEKYRFLDSEQLWDFYNSKRNGLFIGVDWNTPNVGAKIIFLVSYSVAGINEIAVAKVETIKHEEFSQLYATQRLIDIVKTYKPDKIYADVGYGASQAEMIKSYGDSHPELNLDNIFRSIDFKSSVEIETYSLNKVGQYNKEPEKIKVRCKNFMISLISKHLKSKTMVLPKFEDFPDGLIEDLRSFKLDRIGENGEPVYSKPKKGQHKHMALALACYAYYHEKEKIYKKESKKVSLNIFDINSILTKPMSQITNRNENTNQSQYLMQYISLKAFESDDLTSVGRRNFGGSKADRSRLRGF